MTVQDSLGLIFSEHVPPAVKHDFKHQIQVGTALKKIRHTAPPKYFTTNIVDILATYGKFLYHLGVFPYKIRQVAPSSILDTEHRIEFSTSRIRQVIKNFCLL